MDVEYQMFINVGTSLVRKNDNIEKMLKKKTKYLKKKQLIRIQVAQIEKENELLSRQIISLNDKLHLKNIRYSCLSNFIATNLFDLNNYIISLMGKYNCNIEHANKIKQKYYPINLKLHELNLRINQLKQNIF